MAGELDAVVAGELYVDLILSGFDHWPQPGQESFAKQYRREIGGGTAITACGLAKLGTRTGVIGVVGTDSGEWVKEQLSGRGVDIAGLLTDDVEPTGVTVAASTEHDRAFLTYAGANRRLNSVLLDCDRLPRARHVHLACAPPPDVLQTVVRAKRGTLSLDAGWHPAWLADPRIRSILKDVDLFFPNESEARHMTGENNPGRMLHSLHAEGFRRVALKLGPSGSGLLWDGDILFAPAPAVTPVDTTGAGDCFDAGFLHAWLDGQSPEECLRIGNICGARSTQAYGGIAGFPTREDLCAK